jgi:hypothetical protein
VASLYRPHTAGVLCISYSRSTWIFTRSCGRKSGCPLAIYKCPASLPVSHFPGRLPPFFHVRNRGQTECFFGRKSAATSGFADHPAHRTQALALAIVDHYTRQCLPIEVDLSLPGARVLRALKRLAEERDLPEAIKLDNGPVFEALRRW